ncbi:MAG: DUF5683 domain-containing protein [Bacteroidales bacterium OttesenSCG-928-I14]|nr:DUF5683 domain-containing protein [Bacteroidales bacterium OttesenSCG-928-I14]
MLAFVAVVQANSFVRFNTNLESCDSLVSCDDIVSVSDSLSKLSKYKYFSPNPNIAVIYSAVFPGLGQVYNRKYWKLPIVYAGFSCCIYSIICNSIKYNYYKNTYTSFSRVNFSEYSKRYQFGKFGKKYLEWSNKRNIFIEKLKNEKEFYRRYRDLSCIATFGWYALFVVDAYVDAQLFNFDIGEDLSLRVNIFFANEVL